MDWDLSRNLGTVRLQSRILRSQNFLYDWPPQVVASTTGHERCKPSYNARNADECSSASNCQTRLILFDCCFKTCQDLRFEGQLRFLNKYLKTYHPLPLDVFLNGPLPASLFFIFVFSAVNMSCIGKTSDFWHQKRLLCQLNHNHCPQRLF